MLQLARFTLQFLSLSPQCLHTGLNPSEWRVGQEHLRPLGGGARQEQPSTQAWLHPGCASVSEKQPPAFTFICVFLKITCLGDFFTGAPPQTLQGTTFWLCHVWGLG